MAFRNVPTILMLSNLDKHTDIFGSFSLERYQLLSPSMSITLTVTRCLSTATIYQNLIGMEKIRITAHWFEITLYSFCYGNLIKNFLHFIRAIRCAATLRGYACLCRRSKKSSPVITSRVMWWFGIIGNHPFRCKSFTPKPRQTLQPPPQPQATLGAT